MFGKKIFQKSLYAVSVTLCEKLRCGRPHPDIYFCNNVCLLNIKSDFLKGQIEGQIYLSLEYKQHSHA